MQFTDIVHPILTRWKQSHPYEMHTFGVHEYDGQLPDFSTAFLQHRATEIRQDLQMLSTLATKDKFQKFEVSILKLKLEEELFEIEERKEYQTNPVVYIFPLTIIELSYTARKFGTLDSRIKHIISIEQAIPKYLEIAYENLDQSLAQAKIAMSMQFLRGIINFFKDNLIGYILKSDDESLIDAWSEANIAVVAALQKFYDNLEHKYLPQAHTDFRLGEEKFLSLLQKTEGISLSVDQLLHIGEEDLARNLTALQEITKRRGQAFLDGVKNDYPAPSELVQEATATLNRTMEFLKTADIVSLPTEKQCKVIPTPEFARSFAFAALNPPGPFEENSDAYYWVTIPDATWSEERQQKFMQFFSRAFLEIVTIHEVWPGHYLQLLYVQQSKSEITKLLARSITMIEGWAHYCEEMIYEQGYKPFDRDKLRLGQLFGALTRNIRYLVAINMHCRNMNVDEAQQMFMERALLTEDTARMEAFRGTIDPMYLNYALGKYLIKKLLQDVKAERGDAFSLKAFHDELLSYGSPPITALRSIMLQHDSTVL